MLCISECTEVLPCNSPPIYSYARYILFIGLLADLPAILDRFFTSDFIGVVSWGWWRAMKWQGKTHVK